MNVSRNLLRLLALAVAALSCAALAGFAALYTQSKSLPPTDGAYGLSALELLDDPLVRWVWTTFVTLGAGLGFMLSVWLLWRVRLSRAIPVVTTVTVIAAAATGPLPPLSGFAALTAGVAAMLWCRGKAGRESNWSMQDTEGLLAAAADRDQVGGAAVGDDVL